MSTNLGKNGNKTDGFDKDHNDFCYNFANWKNSPTLESMTTADINPCRGNITQNILKNHGSHKK